MEICKYGPNHSCLFFVYKRPAQECCILCRRDTGYGFSLERVLKMLFVRCASHLVGDLCQMKGAFILSKLSVFLWSDLIFTCLLTWINVGISDSLIILPAILAQAGILSLIMSLTGFFCAVLLSDFKQFSLFYLILAVFASAPVFLAGQTGVSWKWLAWHPMHHLFTAMKSAYFGKTAASFPYYLVCMGAIAILFYGACYMLARETAKEG